jgi:hypothetical protein
MTAGKVCRQPVVRKVMGLPGRRGSPSSGVTVGQGRMLKPSIEASGVQGTASELTAGRIRQTGSMMPDSEAGLTVPALRWI